MSGIVLVCLYGVCKYMYLFVLQIHAFFVLHQLKCSLPSLLPTQDLLQLQYEGLAIMKMFVRAKVNVNLLIFLMNKNRQSVKLDFHYIH